ncbi:hypothetical protein [Cellulomonas soli]
MDGYAVRYADVAGATAADPVVLPVVADLPAGTPERPFLAPGRAARIMTGAPVPDGADTIVPVELTDAGTAVVRIDEAPDRPARAARRGRRCRGGPRGRDGHPPRPRPGGRGRVGRPRACAGAPAAAGRGRLDGRRAGAAR